MLRTLNFSHYKNIWILPNYTDMRQGIDKLAALVQCQLHLNPFDEHAVFLFCGRQRSHLKALVFEGDGFTLVYHRIHPGNGQFQWPMTEEEVLRITPDQYRRLLDALTSSGSASCLPSVPYRT